MSPFPDIDGDFGRSTPEKELEMEGIFGAGDKRKRRRTLIGRGREGRTRKKRKKKQEKQEKVGVGTMGREEGGAKETGEALIAELLFS